MLLRDAGDGAVVGGLRADRPARAATAGRAGDRPLHRPGAADAGGARPAGGRRGARRGARPPGRGPRGRLSRSTSTGPPTRCSIAPGAATATVLGKLAPDLPPDHEPSEPADGDGAAADRALLPDRRRVRARHGRPDGAADARRSRHRFPGDAPAARLGRGQAARRRSGGRRRGRRRVRPRLRAARGLSHDRAPRPRRARTCSRRCARRCSRPRAGRAMQRPFQRLAIVNRGEPAMRLIHAVRELNEAGPSRSA